MGFFSAYTTIKNTFLGTDYAVALCNHISKTVKSV